MTVKVSYIISKINWLRNNPKRDFKDKMLISKIKRIQSKPVKDVFFRKA